MKTLIKKYKALFILPLGLLPFIVLIFYILGGASADENENVETKAIGVNYQLPDANRDISILDKQEAYQQVKVDEPMEQIKIEVDTALPKTPLELTEKVPVEQSNELLMAHVKRQELLSREALQLQTEDAPTGLRTSAQRQATARSSKTRSHRGIRTYQASAREEARTADKRTYQPGVELDDLTELVDAHEQLMRQNDSLSRQLTTVPLPGPVQPVKRKSFVVELTAKQGFEQPSVDNQSIKAQVVQNTKVLTGNRVMLRLIQDTQVNGRTIRKGTLIYALCKTDNERLQLLITSLPYQEDFIPVSLSAYDLDGIKGLYVPDNVNRKVYKDVAGGVNPSVLFSASDDPLSYMGVNAAANLSKTVIKRVKLKRVYLRQNSVLILKND
ncbi:conjugative transposon protein TraM [Carboxylicivirga sp. RSCT41]|uniref:conjugative transposon protein TraM n=1 Tax=Carboxylicivirga agarovorans TaxID=3417570 RepID=UPI003D350C5A